MSVDPHPAPMKLLLPSRIIPSLLLLLVAGCATPPTPLPPSSTHATELPMSVAEGRARELATGNNRAYWIWVDPDGLWHVRTTAARAGRHFQGTIPPTAGGEIVDLRNIGLESDDKIGFLGRTLSFKWRTRNRIDGFDFRLRGEGCLEFDLSIDGDATSRFIYLGKAKTRPEGAHFILCPK